MADNRTLVVTGDTANRFEAAMQLGWAYATATSYRIDPDLGFVLYWGDKAPNTHPLPYPMKVAEVTAMVLGWLEVAEYPPEPDIDGSCTRGWKVYCGEWGHVGGEFQAFLAIAPHWMLYGK